MSLTNQMILSSATVHGPKPDSTGGWTHLSQNNVATVNFGTNHHNGDFEWPYFSVQPQTLVSNIGCRSLRDGPSWTLLEPVLGAGYNWGANGPHDLMLTLADIKASNATLNVWNIMSAVFPPSGLSMPLTTSPGLASLAAYITEVVTHFVGLGYTSNLRVSFGNEFNSGAFSGPMTGGQYYTMLAVVYDAVKAVNSSVQVGGPVGVDLDDPGANYADWTTAFLATNWKNKCDFFDHHAYYSFSGGVDQRTPEYLITRIESLHAKVFASSPTIPITISETGWYTSLGFAISETLKSQYYTRYPFLLRSLPNVESVQFYELRDSDTRSWGLSDSSWNAKASSVAVTQALSVVHSATSARRSSHINTTSVGVYMVTASGNKYALWDTVGSTSMSLQISAAVAGTLTITSMIDGTTTTSPLIKGRQTKSITIDISSVVLSADVSFTVIGL